MIVLLKIHAAMEEHVLMVSTNSRVTAQLQLGSLARDAKTTLTTALMKILARMELFAPTVSTHLLVNVPMASLDLTVSLPMTVGRIRVQPDEFVSMVVTHTPACVLHGSIFYQNVFTVDRVLSVLVGMK